MTRQELIEYRNRIDAFNAKAQKSRDARRTDGETSVRSLAEALIARVEYFATEPKPEGRDS